MEADAQAYTELNRPQIESSTKFIDEFSGISLGDKVLDMGCGTGEVTKYIAETVGSGGQVVGIDPDAARIKIAKEKFQNISNLEFHVGNSETRFPHANELYYDVHISTFVFHWLNNGEKKTYIQKAYECLKPGGKLSIYSAVKVGVDSLRDEQQAKFGFILLTKDGYKKLFQDVGLFPNVVVEKVIYPKHFKSLDEFKRWFKATTHHDLDEIDPAYVKRLDITDDGSVIEKHPYVAITASKI